jgi:predicted outer membrane repeat protein
VADGGALSIKNAGNLTLKNNKFNYNQARQSGGAVSSNCISSQCFLIIDGLNTFVNNLAGISGGAI